MRLRIWGDFRYAWNAALEVEEIMQSARIWFKQKSPRIGLNSAKIFFEKHGIAVEDTEWRLESFVVPQLSVSAGDGFLIQINDDTYVIEEAEEFAEWSRDELTPQMIAKLKDCDVRFEIGANSTTFLSKDVGIVVLEGFSPGDINSADTRALLQALTREVDGIFEDNINGVWWSE